MTRWRSESWPDLLHGAVKTHAPRARTPVLDEWQTRDHLSVMGGGTPRGKVYTLVRPRPLNGLHTMDFLLHLGRSAGDRLLVVWEGSPIHRRPERNEFGAEARRKIRRERLPSYVPNLNSVEWLWRHLQEVELRNVTCVISATLSSRGERRPDFWSLRYGVWLRSGRAGFLRAKHRRRRGRFVRKCKPLTALFRWRCDLRSIPSVPKAGHSRHRRKLALIQGFG